MNATRILVIVIFLMSSMKLFGQIQNFESIPGSVLEHFPEIGVDSSFIMNSYESNYFNVIFKDARKDFDFTGKKIGFITGSNANSLSNKQKYFTDEKKRFENKLSIISSQLYIFNVNEKEESGGYDAVIVYWSKIVVSHKDLVKKLKTQPGKKK